jgi:hypothetical protein
MAWFDKRPAHHCDVERGVGLMLRQNLVIPALLNRLLQALSHLAYRW